MASSIEVDAVGIFWLSLAACWTVAVIAGASFLLYNYRRCPPLRIRGIPLSVGAVALLHGYWVSVQVGYVVRHSMPGDAEYWIMGTWLPLGIALFHASNSRFLHVAKSQRRFVRNVDEEDEERHDARRPRGLVSRFRRMDHTRKIFTLVGAGMVFQVRLLGLLVVCIPAAHRVLMRHERF